MPTWAVTFPDTADFSQGTLAATLEIVNVFSRLSNPRKFVIRLEGWLKL